MAKARQDEGAQFKRGIFSVPRGTIENIQFCKGGILRIARTPKVQNINVIGVRGANSKKKG